MNSTCRYIVVLKGNHSLFYPVNGIIILAVSVVNFAWNIVATDGVNVFQTEENSVRRV